MALGAHGDNVRMEKGAPLNQLNESTDESSNHFCRQGEDRVTVLLLKSPVLTARLLWLFESAWSRASSTIRRCGFDGMGVALLEELHNCVGGL